MMFGEIAKIALGLLPLLVHPSTAHRWTDDLTLQAAYHVVYSYPGLEPPSQLFDLIKQGKVGGIILFGENVNGSLPDIIESFHSAYAESAGSSGQPLLIMTDQEGGEVRRLPGGPDLSEKEVGESTNPTSAAQQAGEQAGTVLEAYKVNTNLAPVLGVYRQAGDFLDQYQRSYSNNATVVGECAGAFISAQQGMKTISTAKHFPGLGAATADENTDVQPVTIALTLSELRSIDMAPYHQAIAAGVDMVMSSWALYPALDAERPSGLSRAWIQDELRGTLGFEGVTISDAIEAGALEAFGENSNRAILASQAGMDIILAASMDVTQGETIVDALVQALNNGTLAKGPFEEASQRIINLRRKLA
jgi:beta-glucosidase-like glycosyl hydrolase